MGKKRTKEEIETDELEAGTLAASGLRTGDIVSVPEWNPEEELTVAYAAGDEVYINGIPDPYHESDVTLVRAATDEEHLSALEAAADLPGDEPRRLHALIALYGDEELSGAMTWDDESATGDAGPLVTPPANPGEEPVTGEQLATEPVEPVEPVTEPKETEPATTEPVVDGVTAPVEEPVTTPETEEVHEVVAGEAGTGTSS